MIRDDKTKLRTAERAQGKKYYRGEVFWAQLPDGDLTEQMGLRPVLVIQNDIGNRYSPNVIVVAITAEEKPDQVTHVEIDLNEPSIILCEYITTISKRRLKGFIRKLTDAEMESVNDSLAKSIGLKWIV